MNQEMKFLADALDKDQTPLAFRACNPRGIQPPTGYCNPRYYAALMVGDLIAIQHPGSQALPHVTAYMNALMLIANTVPTYFISYEFAQAVANTELPGDFKFSELKWPLDAQLFVLPDQFVYQYYGVYAPFISVSKVQPVKYPDALGSRIPELEVDLPMVEPNVEKVLIDYPIFHQVGTPTDYNGNYPTSMGIEAFKDSPWVDSTPFERERVSMLFGPDAEGLRWKQGLSGDQETEYIDKALRFAMKLMLCVAARPGLVEHGHITRPAKVDRAGRSRGKELWSPNIIGRAYRIPRQAVERTVATGERAKPRFVFRRGHWTWQAKRVKGVEFVSVEQMPRKEAPTSAEEATKVGVIDFSAAGPELEAKFRACHERMWIDGILFGDREEIALSP